MKLIIKNNANIDAKIAFHMVNKVIIEGLISDGGKSYCYYTIFNVGDKKVSVAAKKNSQTSHTFKIEWTNQ